MITPLLKVCRNTADNYQLASSSARQTARSIKGADLRAAIYFFIFWTYGSVLPLCFDIWHRVTIFMLSKNLPPRNGWMVGRAKAHQ